MWERKTGITKMECQRCKERKRPRMKRQLKVDGGPTPGIYLVCPHCDGTAGSVPEDIRSA